jgi:hypothetical protein
MKTIKDLTIKITYEVSLGNIEVPKKVYKQLLKSAKKGKDIEMQSLEFDDAEIWITENFKERDCTEWKAEIVDLIKK